MVRSRQSESSIYPGETEDAGKEENKGPGPEAGQGGCVKQNTLVRERPEVPTQTLQGNRDGTSPGLRVNSGT